MSREKLDELLKELTNEDITTDRKLEIFKEIQEDKDKSLAEITDLNDKNIKLVNDYKALEKKSVDDFFNRGTYSKEAEEDFNDGGTVVESEPLKIEDLLEK